MRQTAARRWLRCVPALLLLIACGGAAAPETPTGTLAKTPPLQLTRTEAGHEATLLFQAAADLLSLQVRPLGDDASPLPMTRRTALWAPLLDELFAQHGRRPTYLLAVGDYPELNARLAAAAACSDEWDVTRGRPRSGDAGSSVVRCLDGADAYGELTQLFTPRGYRVSTHSAESVLTCAWKEVPRAAAEVECARDVSPDAIVPCGASILFRLTSTD